MKTESNSVFIVSEHVVNEYDECSSPPMVFAAYGDALKELKKRYRFARSNKCFLSDCDKEEEKSEMSFSIWDSGYYGASHYDAQITSMEVIPPSDPKPLIANRGNKGHEKTGDGGLW